MKQGKNTNVLDASPENSNMWSQGTLFYLLMLAILIITGKMLTYPLNLLLLIHDIIIWIFQSLNDISQILLYFRLSDTSKHLNLSTEELNLVHLLSKMCIQVELSNNNLDGYFFSMKKTPRFS
jgi:hypothetical protein